MSISAVAVMFRSHGAVYRAGTAERRWGCSGDPSARGQRSMPQIAGLPSRHRRHRTPPSAPASRAIAQLCEDEGLIWRARARAAAAVRRRHAPHQAFSRAFVSCDAALSPTVAPDPPERCHPGLGGRHARQIGTEARHISSIGRGDGVSL